MNPLKDTIPPNGGYDPKQKYREITLGRIRSKKWNQINTALMTQKG
jgi:hypothetical protein